MYYLILCLLIIIPLKIQSLTISIYPEESYQEMDGIGANSFVFPIANDMGWNWDQVRDIFDDLDLHYIRMFVWFDLWEKYNDNNDPYSINWIAFDPLGIIRNHDLKFAQYIQAKGIQPELGIWGFSDWLAKGSPKTVPPEYFPEVGESIASYLLYMQKNGIIINVAELQNEPDIEAGINYLNAENAKNATLHVIDQLQRHRLDQVKLHGPNLHSPNNTVEWGQELLAVPEIKRRYAAISYHTWWVNDKAAFTKIREFAKKQKLPVWATEVGYCALPSGCFDNTHFLKPETWETAWDYALSYYRSIAWSHASRLYHWALLGHDGVVKPNGEKTPSYYILKHFSNYIPPQSVMISAYSGDPELLVLAFKLPAAGAFTLIVINTSEGVKEFKLDKLDVQEAKTTEPGGYFYDNPPSLGVMMVPPHSITSLKLSK